MELIGLSIHARDRQKVFPERNGENQDEAAKQPKESVRNPALMDQKGAVSDDQSAQNQEDLGQKIEELGNGRTDGRLCENWFEEATDDVQNRPTTGGGRRDDGHRG